MLDPASYVELWLKDSGHHGGPDYARRYDTWLSWFEETGIEGVGFGWINVRLGAGAAGRHELLEWPYDVEQPIGPAIHDWGAAVDDLRDLTDDALMGASLRAREDVQQETVGRPGAEDPEAIVLRQQRGFRRARTADTVEAAFLGACDGDLTVGQLFGALAQLTDTDADQLRSDLPPRRARARRRGLPGGHPTGVSAASARACSASEVSRSSTRSRRTDAASSSTRPTASSAGAPHDHGRALSQPRRRTWPRTWVPHALSEVVPSVVGDPDLGDRPLRADGCVGLADDPGDTSREPRGRHPLGELGQRSRASSRHSRSGAARSAGEQRLAQVAQQLVGDQPRLVGDRVEVVAQARQRDGGAGHRQQLLAAAGHAVQPAQRLLVVRQRRRGLDHRGPQVLVVAPRHVGVRAVLDALAPRVDQPSVDEDEVAEPAALVEPLAGLAPEQGVVVVVVHRSSWVVGVGPRSAPAPTPGDARPQVAPDGASSTGRGSESGPRRPSEARPEWRSPDVALPLRR